ncbi:MAG: hypothetical protein Q7O66_16610 [Dehalococcoidia bacterium]|nr:hypothetical protein [Dehalococcoidia bacterium]
MIEKIRASVRPIVTVAAVLATIGFIAFGTSIPQDWWVLLSAIVAWWFSSRAPAKAP